MRIGARFAKWGLGLFLFGVLALLGVFAVGYPGYFVFDRHMAGLLLLADHGRKECLAARTGAVHCNLLRRSDRDVHNVRHALDTIPVKAT